MARTGLTLVALAAALALAVPVGLAWSSSETPQALGSITLPRAVSANGQSLAAGTYDVRVSSDAVSAVVGQDTDGAAWVEFVRSGEVRGRELATVLTGDAVDEVAKGGAPASGSSKVEVLKGNEYLRVWINAGGTHYLLHFAVSSLP